jgi:hypothetical protein
VNEFAFKVGDRVGHSEEDARLWFDENPEGLGTIVEVPSFSEHENEHQ